MNEIIGETIIGSHIWKMNHRYSDIDRFQVYVVPTRFILDGSAKTKSECIATPKEDTTSHEIGHVINYLLDGNINFIIGVLSNKITKTTPEFEELRKITRNNLSKCTTDSVVGMAIRNYQKYIVTGKDDTPKKRRTIMRTLKFGQNLLLNGEIEFLPYNGSATNNDILENISILQGCENVSLLPDFPDEKDFREWLYKTRISHLER